jgi:hypothetical protein
MIPFSLSPSRMLNLRPDTTSLFPTTKKISQMGLSYLVYPGLIIPVFITLWDACIWCKRQWTCVLKGFHQLRRRKRFIYCYFIARYRARTVFHAMEKSIVEDVHHEEISLLLHHWMLNLRTVNLAIQVFEGDYRKFMLQLISSQLIWTNGLFKTR